MRSTVPPSALQLDQFVRAYETAQARDGRADLRQFLPPPGDALYRDVLRELIRVDLEFSWERGQPRTLHEYRQLFPELFHDSACLQEIAFEEYRLRCQAGQDPSAEEYQGQFGVDVASWPPTAGSADGRAKPVRAPEGEAGPHEASITRVVAQNGHAGDLRRDGPPLGEERGPTTWPEPGTRFLDFELLAELGRGAFARVFLARQAALANRLVALKVSPRFTDEPQALAQLQHTHIVPIYSIHRAGPWLAVCMPYFGQTTLADVLRHLGDRASLPESGQELMDTLDALQKDKETRRQGDKVIECEEGQTGAESPKSALSACLLVCLSPCLPPTRPAHLERLSYVEAVLWLTARLADGLSHAHERGIVHRDLKPANVLLTEDGQPMLLDFNLSQDTKLSAPASAARMGGTLPYMAPEHLDAFAGGPRHVDARSDVYALGVILHELLTGRHPFPPRSGPLKAILPELLADRQQPPPPVRKGNPAVPPAVEAIVRHCLEPDPARRYQSASDLREDVQRQLDHLPLKHVPEPSLRERLRKWRHRHPRLTSSSAVALAALVLLAGLSAIYLGRQLALSSKQEELDRLGAADTLLRFREELNAIRYLLLAPNVKAVQREEGLALCRHVLERYRVRGGPEWLERPAVCALPAADRQWLREHLGEMLLHMARGLAQQAEATPEAVRREQLGEALHLNQLAESCYAPEPCPPAVWRQRADLRRLAGEEEEAQHLTERAMQAPWNARRDEYLLLWDYLDGGRMRELAGLLWERSREEPPTSLLWLLLGDCQMDLDDPTKALNYYNLAITQQPETPWAHFKRGVVHLMRQSYQEAAADFDAFLRKREDAEAYLHRAQARIGLGKLEDARKDLTEALKVCEPPVRTLLLRARVREQLGDHPGAQKDRDEGMRGEPQEEADWVARAQAQLPAAPHAALADFDNALKKNPWSRQALQGKAQVLAEHLNQPGEAKLAFDEVVRQYQDIVTARTGRGVVLARLGDRAAAHEDAAAALQRDARPETHYQAARIYALTSREHPEDRPKALQHLAIALRQGYGGKELDTDRDLQPLRAGAEFQKLAEAARTLDAGANAKRK